MDPFQMNPMMPDALGGSPDETSLLSILVNMAFGFVAGLMFFFGPKEVIAYGSELAGEIINLAGYRGGQMAAYGFATMAAPYILLAPLGGMVVRQLSSVRNLKSFAYFAAAVLVGIGGAYLSQGYFSTLIIS